MSKRSGCKFLSLVAGLGLSVLGAANAHAGFTSINAPDYGKGDEATQAEILSNSYGGSFSSSGLDFTNGSITATRVNDNDDQFLPTAKTITSVKALASFARYTQSFGYGSVSSPTILFTVTGKGFNVSGSYTAPLNLAAGTAGVRSGAGFNQSSINAANKDGLDHLVTYILTGSSVKAPTYVLFFEDKTKQQHSDFDFNDLAVEVKTSSPTVVPLPAAAWSGLITLAGGALVGGYRKARRQMA